MTQSSFTNTSMMLSMVFIPLLAEDLGASYMQIGIIMSVYGLCLGVSSYMFSKAADAWNIKRLLPAGLACSAAAYLLQVFADDPLSLGLARGLLGIAIGMYPAALIIHVYGMKRSISKFISFCALGWAAGFITPRPLQWAPEHIRFLRSGLPTYPGVGSGIIDAFAEAIFRPSRATAKVAKTEALLVPEHIESKKDSIDTMPEGRALPDPNREFNRRGTRRGKALCP